MATTKTSTRRVFGTNQCHWREGGLGDREGKPACRRPRVSAHANLCKVHEPMWQKAARARYRERDRLAIIAEYEAAKSA